MSAQKGFYEVVETTHVLPGYLYTLSDFHCVAAALSADASRVKNSFDDFLDAHQRSVLCSSAYTARKNSKNVSAND